MISTINFSTARLCLILIIIFNHASGLTFVSDSNLISVTDFKYHRKIVFKNQQLLLYKNPSIKSVFYLSDQYEFDFIKQKSHIANNFELKSKTTKYKIYFANGKTRFFSKKKGIYFESVDNSVCKKTLNENFLKLDVKQYTRGIEENTIASLTDDTCNENQKQKVGVALRDTLLQEKSWLSRCFSNSSINKLVENDQNYLKYSLSVYSKYLNLVKKLNEGEQAIKISCKVSTKGKFGSFDETTNPAKISFDWDNISKKNGTDESLNENLKTTLGHELFHYGEQIQTQSDAEFTTCINESYAKLFTDVCTVVETNELLKISNKTSADKIKNQKIPTSSEVEVACKNNTKIAAFVSGDASANASSLKNTSASSTTVASGTSATYAGEQQKDQKTNEAINAKLNNGTNQVTHKDFTQPSDSDFAVLASNTTPNVQYGKPYTVPANSTFGETVKKTLNSFTASGNTLTTKLNNAIGVSTNTAQAGNATLATNKITARTTYTSTDLPALTKEGTTTTSTATANTENSNANSRMTANVGNTSNFTGTAGKRTPSSSDGPSEMAGGNGDSSSGTKNRAPASTDGIRRGMASNTSSGLGETNSASKAAKNTFPQKDGADMVKTIQSLKAFNTLTGGQYQEIKKYYTNPQFLNLLETYDMNIMVMNSTGRPESIGVDRKKAKKAFNDDGQILKTIQDKK